MKRLALIAALSAIALPALAQEYVVTPYGNGSQLLVTPNGWSSTLPPGYGTSPSLPPGYGTSPSAQQSFIIPNTNATPSGSCFSNAFHRC